MLRRDRSCRTTRLPRQPHAAQDRRDAARASSGGAALPRQDAQVRRLLDAAGGARRRQSRRSIARSKSANELDLPVVAFFSAISNFPRANLRHYSFLNQGLHDIEEDLAEARRAADRAPPSGELARSVPARGRRGASSSATRIRCREPERWRRVLAGRLKIPFWTVDADVVVPSRLFTKHFYAQHLFRRQLYRALSEYLCRRRSCQSSRRHGRRSEDRSVRRSTTTSPEAGGTSTAA